MTWLKYLAAASFVTCLVSSARAEEGPYVGVELGVSEPTNDNYRSHVETGVTGAPFAGYMLDDYLGLQGHLHFNAQQPDDNDGRPQANLNRNQWTTMLGMTAGPRLSLPLGDAAEIYGVGEGGGFKGLGGRLNQWAPGFTVGGGVDFYLTQNFAIGLFGRWNRAYMAPHPTFLVGHVDNDQGPKDARWVSAGLALKVTFNEPAAAPPPPPPPPPAVVQAPPPPHKQRTFVLKNVNFDFNKATLRPDARPVLQEVVDTLKNNSDWSAVVVEGHTDSIGSDSYNKKLSQRRADSVREYLIREGIDGGRIKSIGYGKSRPVASNKTDEGRAENRRVEIHID